MTLSFLRDFFDALDEAVHWALLESSALTPDSPPSEWQRKLKCAWCDATFTMHVRFADADPFILGPRCGHKRLVDDSFGAKLYEKRTGQKVPDRPEVER